MKDMSDELRTKGENSKTRTFSPETVEQLSQAFPIPNWDHYQFIQVLGKGGMGEVYKALDPRLQRHVALKFIQGDSRSLADRFQREARAQARIDHDFVCKIYEIGEAAGKPYIAMQYIEGATLGDIRDSITLRQKVEIMSKVARAIHAAHKQGLIHRDIKPSNILLQRTDSNEWRPYVTDFGLAREIHSSGTTTTGVILGTPWYLSPEQARGNADEIGPQSDIYSIGATLYELLSGKPPFSAPTPIEVVVKVLSEQPKPLRQLGVDVPKSLDSIVMKCLEKNAAQRYTTAQELADELQKFLDSFVEHIKARSIPGARILAPALAAFLVIAGIWLIYNKRKDAVVPIPPATSPLKSSITLRFNRTPLKEAFKQIGAETGLTIKMDSRILGDTSLALDKVTPQEAVKNLCDRHLLDCETQGKSVNIGIPLFQSDRKSLITMDYDNVKLSQIFSELAKAERLTLAVSRTVKKSAQSLTVLTSEKASTTVALHVSQRPWEYVLYSLCKKHGLEYSIDKDRLYVVPEGKLYIFLADEPLSLDFKDIELHDLFHFIGDISGMNIILDPEVKGKTSIKIVDLTVEQALQLICKNNGLGYTVKGKNVRIATIQKLQNEDKAEKYLPPITGNH